MLLNIPPSWDKPNLFQYKRLYDHVEFCKENIVLICLYFFVSLRSKRNVTLVTQRQPIRLLQSTYPQSCGAVKSIVGNYHSCIASNSLLQATITHALQVIAQSPKSRVTVNACNAGTSERVTLNGWMQCWKANGGVDRSRLESNQLIQSIYI